MWEVEPRATDSWTWKCLIQCANEFRVAIQPQGGLQLGEFLNGAGKISCEKIYQIFRTRQNTKVWGQFLWKGLQCKKWSVVMWLALYDRLYTRNRLFKWGAVTSQECVFCGTPSETVNHLWFECAYTRCVADIVLGWVGVTHRAQNPERWMTWFGGASNDRNLVFRLGS